MPDPNIHAGGQGTVSLGGAVIASTGWEGTESAEWVDVTTTYDYDVADDTVYTRKISTSREFTFSFEGFVDEGNLTAAQIRAGTVTGAVILKLFTGGTITMDHARVMSQKIASGGPKGVNTFALQLENQGKVTWIS